MSDEKCHFPDCPKCGAVKGWYPIETAPKGEKPILLFWDFRPLTGEEAYGVDLCYWDEASGLFTAESPGLGYSCARAPAGYSHWMPLPEPPK